MDFESRMASARETFRMEYINYILIILGIMSICLLMLRRTGRELRGSDKTVAGRHSSKPSKPTDKSSGKPEFPATAVHIPTPWGWPGNDPVAGTGEHHDVSVSLHRFVDHLLSEKQTTESRAYLLKRNESLRAMIEDRYGRSTQGRKSGDSIEQSASAGAGSTSRPVPHGSLAEIRKPWGW